MLTLLAILVLIWRSVKAFPLSDYIRSALDGAEYDKLEDGSFSGRIPMCKGVVTFARSLRACEDSLRSTLEEWILLALNLGHRLPVLDGINLNRKPRREPMVFV